MHSIFKKLSSRKFWIALAGITTGVAMALGADGSDINSMTGAITTLISAMTYIIVEGKIDAESVKNVVENVHTGVEVLEDES